MKEKPVSRREFLKIAGVAGASVGLAGGLGGIVAACGSEEATTTTAAPASTTTTAAQTTTSTSGAASTTTVSAAAEKGRPIKVGVVSAATGALAAFSMTEKWWMPHLRNAVGEGLACADGKTHTFDIKSVDSQSDSARAAQVAGDLVMNDKVDILMAAASPGVGIPVQGTAEALECPCLVTFTVPEAQLHAAPNGLKWTYMFTQSNMQGVIANEAGFAAIPTNKKVGFTGPNNDDGISWEMMLPPYLESKGWDVIAPGLYQPGTEDFTSIISAFKKAGCEAFMHAGAIPPDFTNLWKQCYQQSFQPKVVTGGASIFFPATMNAVGDIGLGMVLQAGWNPAFPFKDSLTGMAAPELAAEFESATGNQWDITVSALGTVEWLVDIFKRSTNVDDKAETIKSIQATKMDTIIGPIDFTAPVDEKGKHMAPNVCLPPIAMAQWRKGSGKYPYDQFLILSLDPNELPVEGQIEPMKYE